MCGDLTLRASIIRNLVKHFQFVILSGGAHTRKRVPGQGSRTRVVAARYVALRAAFCVVLAA